MSTYQSTPPKKLNRITAKFIENELNVSTTTSKRYLKDIKNEYNIKIVTEQHLYNYLKV